MVGSPYKKDWLVRTGIARGMISTPVSERLPTLSEYCEAFGCSRGVVQTAIASLEESGAVRLSKKGKQGSFLEGKNDEILFDKAGLHYLTGSMPTPLNIHLAGLATGICQAMTRCFIPFTFAFVQGGKNRAEALGRQVYDFVVVTRATARAYIAANPELEEAFPLSGCKYSLDYVLYMNAPGLTKLEDGMTIAADPACHDQYILTKAVCAGRSVNIAEMSYIASRQAFVSGEADAIVFREDDGSFLPYLGNLISPAQRVIDLEKISAVPLRLDMAEDMQLPVVLVNKKNYGMAGILRSYLGGELVSFIQNKVINQEMAPQFF